MKEIQNINAKGALTKDENRGNTTINHNIPKHDIERKHNTRRVSVSGREKERSVERKCISLGDPYIKKKKKKTKKQQTKHHKKRNRKKHIQLPTTQQQIQHK